MTTDLLLQIFLGLFGATAIYLVGCKNPRISRWGYIFGLAGQPFWIITAIINHQWGILALTSFYSFSWGRGIYNHWIKKQKQNGVTTAATNSSISH